LNKFRATDSQFTKIPATMRRVRKN